MKSQIQNLDTFKKSGGLERRVIQGLGLHPGENEFLARENRRRGSLQFGVGTGPGAGAFLDIDGFNPLFDVGSFFGHIFWNNVDQNRFLEKRGYEQCFEDSPPGPAGQ